MTDPLLEWRDKPKRQNPEETLQRAIVQHLRLLGKKDCIWFAVPNGIPSSKRTGARFKAQGLTAGVSDLCFVLSDGSFAAMELKAKGGRMSTEQKAFAAKCEMVGAPYAVCYDLDSALSVLRAWGVIK